MHSVSGPLEILELTQLKVLLLLLLKLRLLLELLIDQSNDQL